MTSKTTLTKQQKPKKCAICHEHFKPRTSLQKVCSPSCAIIHAERTRKRLDAKKARDDRKVLREKKERLKTRGEWLDDVQKVFNAYIRKRDEHLPCISCGTLNPNIQYCAGHYKTRGSSPHLRFDERNVHKQCNKFCNLERSGNIISYRTGLVKKIGLQAVEELEADNTPRHYTIDDLKALKAHYQAKIKELERLNDH